MNDKQCMQRAIELAYQSNEPIPCGVVIAKDGTIISESFNSQHTDFDVTAHAEMKALRLAGPKLKLKNLDGAIAYSTCEPCSMCASALIYGRVHKIFYGMPIANIDHDAKRIKITIEELAARSPRPTIIVGKFEYGKVCRLYQNLISKIHLLDQDKTDNKQ